MTHHIAKFRKDQTASQGKMKIKNSIICAIAFDYQFSNPYRIFGDCLFSFLFPFALWCEN